MRLRLLLSIDTADLKLAHRWRRFKRRAAIGFWGLIYGRIIRNPAKRLRWL